MKTDDRVKVKTDTIEITFICKECKNNSIVLGIGDLLEMGYPICARCLEDKEISMEFQSTAMARRWPIHSFY
jgi:hypothetical protein